MNNIFTTWLILAYGLSVIGYLGRFKEGFPRAGILLGMTMISVAYGFMLLSKVYHKLKPENKEHYDNVKKNDDIDDNKKKDEHAVGGVDGEIDKKKKDPAKIFTIIGYSLASIFFFAIHIFPQLTFTVRYYDIFGAVGYGAAAIGTALVPIILPIGYAITTLYYIFGSYQKLEESEWIGRIQLISRSILALVYGVSALSLANAKIF